MWFLFLGIALSILISGGIFFTRRLDNALVDLGVAQGPRRITKWLIRWFLFAMPALVFLTIAIQLIIGADSFWNPRGWFYHYLIVMPFWIALLVLFQTLPWFLLYLLIGFIVRKVRKTSIPRRVETIVLLGTSLFFTIYTPARIAASRGDFQMRHHEVRVKSESETRLRVTFIADLQIDEHSTKANGLRIAKMANRQNADIILSGGDWVNRGDHFIEEAAQVGGALRAPLGVYSVRGDHEHFLYIDRDKSVENVTKALAAKGVKMLDNKVHRFTHKGKSVAVILLSHNYINRAEKETVQELIAAVQDADLSILVTHQFNSFLEGIVKNEVDLVLAGHTHGGQVNPVFGLWHVAPSRVETRFVDGRYSVGSTQVIVTAGIGFSVAPFRYASPASFEVIDIYF